MKANKLLALLLCLTMCLGLLTACGTQKPAETPAPAAETTAEPAKEEAPAEPAAEPAAETSTEEPAAEESNGRQIGIIADNGDTITVVDQLGRTVEMTKNPQRIIDIQHHSMVMMLELGLEDRLIGVMSGYVKSLGSYMDKYYPELAELPTPGNLKELNIEEIAALEPDLVIFGHQLPEEYVQQLDDAGIPAIGFSMFVAEAEEAAKLDPTLADSDAAYEAGMMEAITMIGEICEVSEKASALNDYILECRALVKERVSTLSDDEKVTVYGAGSNVLSTMGTGKYVDIMITRAGGINVAGELDGINEVTMEQVSLWDPEVVIISNRYSESKDTILADPVWAEITAVKNDMVLVTPEYVKPHGHPAPEAMCIGELWLASTLYPDLFSDINVDDYVNRFYTEFMGCDLIPD